MGRKDTFDRVLAVLPTVARNLQEHYDRQCTSVDTSIASRLVFPVHREKVRVSEQEARILFCNALQASQQWHSIETPTKFTYRQKGEGTTTARSDLAVHADVPSSARPLPDVRIELKAHGAGISEEDFRKDLEKLIREPGDGVLFHTFVATKSKSLEGSLSKLHAALRRVVDLLEEEMRLGLALCVLDKGTLHTSSQVMSAGGKNTVSALGNWLSPAALLRPPWVTINLRKSTMHEPPLST